MDRKLMDYFIERTDARFDNIETKIDTLLKFKWQIISGATVVSIFVSVAFQLIFKG